MQEILFEKFYLLTGICLFLSVTAIYFAYQRRTKFTRNLATAIPVISLILIVLNLMVVTDREQIRALLYKLTAACQNENISAISDIMDKNFQTDEYGKKQFLAATENAFKHVTLSSIRLWGIENNPPTVKFISIVHITDKSGREYGTVRSDWELTFVKRKKSWKLTEARPISINLKPVSGIQAVLSAAQSVW